jgi:hypothetical protein
MFLGELLDIRIPEWLMDKRRLERLRSSFIFG